MSVLSFYLDNNNDGDSDLHTVSVNVFHILVSIGKSVDR